MERVDVLQLVRDNRDKYKQHLQKMKELEDRDKQLNYGNMYKEYSTKERLNTIQEVRSETFSNKNLKENENNPNTNRITNKKEQSDQENNYIYNKIYDSNDEDGIEHDILPNKKYDECESLTNEPREDLRNQDYYKNNRSEDNEDNNDCEEEENDKREESSHKYSIDDLDQSNPKDINNENSNGTRSDEEPYPNSKNVSYDIRKDHYNIKDNSREKSEDTDIDNEIDYNKIYEDCQSSEENEEITPQSKKQVSSIPNRNYLKLPTPKFIQTNTKGLNLTRSNNSNKSDISKNSLTKDNKASINGKDSSNFIKRPYTAYTYSTIKKIKNNTATIKKPSLFESNILNKKYNGKSDRVALYQLHKTYWDKKPYLANKTIKYEEEEKFNPEKKKQLQKLQNITKPIRYYTKI